MAKPSVAPSSAIPKLDEPQHIQFGEEKSTIMKLKKVVLVWALALLGALASVMSAQAQSPDDLGKAIAANYLDALKKVNELMKARDRLKLNLPIYR